MIKTQVRNTKVANNNSQVNKIRSHVLVPAEGKQLHHRHCRHDHHHLHDVQASTRIWPIIIIIILTIILTIVITIIIILTNRQAQGSGRSSSPLSLFSWQQLLCSSLSGTSSPYQCFCNRPTIFFNKTVLSQEKGNIEKHYRGPGLNYSLTISPNTTCEYIFIRTCCRNRIV